MLAKLRSFFSIVLIAALLLGVTFFWFRYLASRPASPVTRVSEGAEVVGPQTLLSLLRSLEGLTLDVSFFDDPVFRSLQDFTPDIPIPAVKGKANPFAPL